MKVFCCFLCVFVASVGSAQGGVLSTLTTSNFPGFSVEYDASTWTVEIKENSESVHQVFEVIELTHANGTTINFSFESPIETGFDGFILLFNKNELVKLGNAVRVTEEFLDNIYSPSGCFLFKSDGPEEFLLEKARLDKYRLEEGYTENKENAVALGSPIGLFLVKGDDVLSRRTESRHSFYRENWGDNVWLTISFTGIPETADEVVKTLRYPFESTCSIVSEK